MRNLFYSHSEENILVFHFIKFCSKNKKISIINFMKIILKIGFLL